MAENFTKEERFNRIAENRVNSIIDKLRLLGQCASRNNYSYNDDQVNAIFTAINQELKLTRSKFNGAKKEIKKFSF